MIFLWTRYYRDTPEPLRSHPGTRWTQARERTRTTPRMILVLKKGLFHGQMTKALAPKTATTGTKLKSARSIHEGVVEQRELLVLNQPYTIIVDEFYKKVATRLLRGELQPDGNDVKIFHETWSSKVDSLMRRLNDLSTSHEAVKNQVDFVSKHPDNTTTSIVTYELGHRRVTSRWNFREGIFVQSYQSQGFWPNREISLGSITPQNWNWLNNSTSSNWYNPWNYNFPQQQ